MPESLEKNLELRLGDDDTRSVRRKPRDFFGEEEERTGAQIRHDLFSPKTSEVAATQIADRIGSTNWNNTDFTRFMKTSLESQTIVPLNYTSATDKPAEKPLIPASKSPDTQPAPGPVGSLPRLEDPNGKRVSPTEVIIPSPKVSPDVSLPAADSPLTGARPLFPATKAHDTAAIDLTTAKVMPIIPIKSPTEAAATPLDLGAKHGPITADGGMPRLLDTSNRGGRETEQGDKGTRFAVPHSDTMITGNATKDNTLQSLFQGAWRNDLTPPANKSAGFVELPTAAKKLPAVDGSDTLVRPVDKPVVQRVSDPPQVAPQIPSPEVKTAEIPKIGSPSPLVTIARPIVNNESPPGVGSKITEATRELSGVGTQKPSEVKPEIKIPTAAAEIVDGAFSAVNGQPDAPQRRPLDASVRNSGGSERDGSPLVSPSAKRDLVNGTGSAGLEAAIAKSGPITEPKVTTGSVKSDQPAESKPVTGARFIADKLGESTQIFNGKTPSAPAVKPEGTPLKATAGGDNPIIPQSKGQGGNTTKPASGEKPPATAPTNEGSLRPNDKKPPSIASVINGVGQQVANLADKGEVRTAPKGQPVKSEPTTSLDPAKPLPSKVDAQKGTAVPTKIGDTPNGPRVEANQPPKAKGEAISAAVKPEGTVKPDTRSAKADAPPAKVDPARPVKPDAPVAKGEVPAAKAEATRPVKSDTPATKADATRPVKSDAPATKADATRPVKSDAPATKADATRPAKSDAPATKADASRPVKSDAPATKADASRPVKSDIPATKADATRPVKSDVPATKADATRPVKSDAPATKADATRPVKSDAPSAKVEPTRTVKSDAPSAKVEPTRTVKSDNTSTPSTKSEPVTKGVKSEASQTVKGESKPEPTAKAAGKAEATKSDAATSRTAKSDAPATTAKGTKAEATTTAQTVKGESGTKSESVTSKPAKSEAATGKAIKGDASTTTTPAAAKSDATHNTKGEAATKTVKADATSTQASKAESTHHNTKSDAKVPGTKADATSHTTKAEPGEKTETGAKAVKGDATAHGTKAETGTKSEAATKAVKGDASAHGTKVEAGTKSEAGTKGIKSDVAPAAKTDVAPTAKPEGTRHEAGTKGIKNDVAPTAKPDGIKNDAGKGIIEDKSDKSDRCPTPGSRVGAAPADSSDGDEQPAEKGEKSKQQEAEEEKSRKVKKTEREEGTFAPFASLLDRKTKSRKTEAKADEKPIKEVRRATQQRTKYIVKQGDTLESIAETELKDARYANLILTINRGSITFVTNLGKLEPVLRVAQVIWLPTLAEREVYAQAIFSTKRARKNTPVVSTTHQNSAQLEMKLPEVALMNPFDAANHAASTSPIHQPNVVPAVTLGKIRRVNQPQPVSLYQIDYHLNQSKLLNKLNTLAENVSTNVWFAGQPAGPAEAPQPKSKGPKTQFPKFFDEEASARLVIERLAATCRVVTTKESEGTNSFNASLEMEVEGRWTTIACYEYRHGHGYRYNFYSNGQSKPFPMDLPQTVVLEMAREDFQRNWANYCREFARQKDVNRSST